jgi:hypothetical protein
MDNVYHIDHTPHIHVYSEARQRARTKPIPHKYGVKYFYLLAHLSLFDMTEVL